tara:strand:+ start:43 stop:627 length:585 start_codon:yes stop_codon:yes gene_type:complete
MVKKQLQKLVKGSPKKPKAKLQTTWGAPLSDFNLANRFKLLLGGNIRGVHPETGDVLWSSNYRKTASQLKRGLVDPVVGIGRTALSIMKMKSMSPPKGYIPNQPDLRITDKIDIKGSERYGETLTTSQVKAKDKAAKIESDKAKKQEEVDNILNQNKESATKSSKVINEANLSNKKKLIITQDQIHKALRNSGE